MIEKIIRDLSELCDVPNEIYNSIIKQESIHPEKATYYRFLYQLSKKIKPYLCVELGTNRGIAAACLALGNPDGKVITIDIKDKKKFEGCLRPNIDFWIQDSLAPLKYNLENIDILFIDTSSKGSRNKIEYDHWIPYMRKGGLVLIDDIHIVEDINGNITTDFMSDFWFDFKPKGTKIQLPLHGKNGFGAIILNG